MVIVLLLTFRICHIILVQYFICLRFNVHKIWFKPDVNITVHVSFKNLLCIQAFPLNNESQPNLSMSMSIALAEKIPAAVQ
jgi:hypothetical protein